MEKIGNRSVRAKSWCFTSYACDKFDEFFKLVFVYMVIGREVCPMTGRNHLQGFVNLETVMGFKKVKQMFSLVDEKVHVEKMRSNIASCVKYCKKDGDFVEKGDVPKQGSRRDLSSIVEKMDKYDSWDMFLIDTPECYNVMRWAKEMFMAKKFGRDRKLMNQIIMNDIKDIKPWQVELIDIIKMGPVRRRVLWYWSGSSGVGKSTMVNMLRCHFDVYEGRYDSENHTVQGYDGQKVIVFDLPRGYSCKLAFYNMLENLSNFGFRSSGMYENKPKMIMCVVLVFSNNPPDESKLPGRFVVKNIDPNVVV